MDDWIDRSFAKDSHGNIISFCWGYSSYYIIPNAKKKSEIQAFLKIYYLVSIGATIVLGVTVGVPYALVTLPISVMWYFLETAHLLRGLKRGHDNLH
jgi:hypothetical protein